MLQNVYDSYSYISSAKVNATQAFLLNCWPFFYVICGIGGYIRHVRNESFNKSSLQIPNFLSNQSSICCGCHFVDNCDFNVRMKIFRRSGGRNFISALVTVEKYFQWSEECQRNSVK